MAREALDDVRVLNSDASAEQLEPAAGAGGLDFGGLEGAGLAELLGHHRCKRVNRRGADDADHVALLGVRYTDGCRQDGGNKVNISTFFMGLFLLVFEFG